MANRLQKAIFGTGRKVAVLQPNAAEADPTPARGKRVLIVGAGFGGLCAAIRLKELGVGALTILERGADVGGTWQANRYPGIAVDTSILQYSFSFDPNPGWSRLFSPGEELQRYAHGIAQKYDVLRHVRFQTAVTELRYDTTTKTWAVSTSTGDTYEADVVIGATGPLSTPSIPNVAGLSSFEGQVLHAGDWDPAWSAKDKVIATIGTGATAAQVVPELAKDAKQLYVFQRSAPWIFPRGDRPITGVEAWAYRHLPLSLKFQRLRRFIANDLVQYGFERQNSTISTQTQMCLDFIDASITDPELRRAVTPDYSVGCKRRVVTDDWFPALQRDNVELITAPMNSVASNTVTSADGQTRAVDAIVLCTGYAVADFMPMKVYGADGVEIHEAWKTNAETYLGTTVSGFPNLFLVGGPGTAIGSGSFIYMIESAVRYLVSAVDYMQRNAVDAVEVRREAQRAYYYGLQGRLASSVYGSGCQGWYQRENGFIDTVWPGLTLEYAWRTRKFRPAKYHLR